jgi:1-deoxy-D-xylulose-5-phosphate reductoisomerase
MKNIYLLGATGSIGMQVLDVINNLKGYKIKTISVGTNIKLAENIIKKYQPEFVSVLHEKDYLELEKKYPHINFGYGDSGLIEAATFGDEDGIVINAVVGMVGLAPTIAAIKKHRDILLANKETLVVAGSLIKDLIKKHKVRLLPIDSEHSAIFQCLQGHNHEDVRKLIITASGGSFRDLNREDLKSVTLEDALNHPNWAMGNKITIDSATMVNKGLEVIEAHYLFDIDYDNIETIIHPESIVHSMVEYRDGSVIAQLSNPDMRIPIQYALTYPINLDLDIRHLDFSKLNKLTFKVMDTDRFPIIKLAYKVGRLAGNMPTVYNSSNEVAVKLFIERKISFLEIEEIITNAVEEANYIKSPTIDDIFETAEITKEKILKKYL